MQISTRGSIFLQLYVFLNHSTKISNPCNDWLQNGYAKNTDSSNMRYNGWICRTVDMPHGGYAATVDMPQRWICRSNKINREIVKKFEIELKLF